MTQKIKNIGGYIAINKTYISNYIGKLTLNSKKKMF